MGGRDVRVCIKNPIIAKVITDDSRLAKNTALHFDFNKHPLQVECYFKKDCPSRNGCNGRGRHTCKQTLTSNDLQTVEMGKGVQFEHTG
ncbi:Uncharacterised protein [uncultured archaeon]|nr:Uncharacterised protein [uncultured archaeon]